MIDQLNAITSIPIASIEKIIDREIAIIADSVYKAHKNKEKTVLIDVGIGKLNILISNDELKFKFIPSNALKHSIMDSINLGISPITDRLEIRLKEKFDVLYKDLL